MLHVSVELYPAKPLRPLSDHLDPLDHHSDWLTSRVRRIDRRHRCGPRVGRVGPDHLAMAHCATAVLHLVPTRHDARCGDRLYCGVDDDLHSVPDSALEFKDCLRTRDRSLFSALAKSALVKFDPQFTYSWSRSRDDRTHALHFHRGSLDRASATREKSPGDHVRHSRDHPKRWLGVKDPARRRHSRLPFRHVWR